MSEFRQYLLDRYGPDRFARVRAASEAHRLEHGKSLPGGEQECGVYPSDALKMRAVTTIVRAAGANLVLEIGGGLGYSALCLAEAAGETGHVETIDRFPEHVEKIRHQAREFGMAGRITAIRGEGHLVLARLEGPYDLIHDDGWFAVEPPYYDRLAGLLRPGGLLVMSNWFLLEHALAEDPPVDWSQFAGQSWARDVTDYARRITQDRRYEVAFVENPSFALAWRRPDA